MKAQLNADDRCAVDLLLERSTSNPDSAPCFTSAPSARIVQRLTRVEQLLHSLDYWNAAEPPADLVARTLARCENAPHPSFPRHVSEGASIRPMA